MISLKCADIPRYLQCGSFYEALGDGEESDDISIQADCFAVDDTVYEFDDFAKMLKVTAFWGLHRIPLSLIQYCRNNEPSIWSGHIREECNELGFAQDLLSVFVSEYNQKSTTPLLRALVTSRTEIVELLAVERNSSTEATAKAAEGGRLDYLKVLHEHHHPWDKKACEKAAEKGYLGCLRYLHEQGCPWDEKVHKVAAENGHLEIIEYARSEGLAWPEDMGDHFAASGKVEMLQCGIAQGCSVNEYTLINVIIRGQTECLRYLLSLHLPVHTRMVVLACQFGHVGCLALLHEHGAELTAQAMHNAAVCEQLECVQYLHEQGCVWNVVVTQVAANRGNVHMLRYAIENGCAFDKTRIIEQALLSVSDGAVECLRYLVEERKTPFGKDGSEFVTALTYGNYKALRYLLDQSCPYKTISRDLSSTWFSALSDHYDTVREKEDEHLVKCLKCVVSHDWDVATTGAPLVTFIRFCGSRFALSRQFLIDHGCC